MILQVKLLPVLKSFYFQRFIQCLWQKHSCYSYLSPVSWIFSFFHDVSIKNINNLDKLHFPLIPFTPVHVRKKATSIVRPSLQWKRRPLKNYLVKLTKREVKVKLDFSPHFLKGEGNGNFLIKRVHLCFLPVLEQVYFFTLTLDKFTR